MSISHREFFRLLPRALQGMSYQSSGNRVQAGAENRTLHLQLTAETSKRLGALELPLTRVRMEAAGYTDKEWRQFLRRFDLAYQRGGG